MSMKTFSCMFTTAIMLSMVQRVWLTACGQCQCHVDRSFAGGIKAVCSSLKLTKIPPLPRNTTSLLMDSNKLKSLPAGAFVGLKKLKHLDLSDNELSRIGEDVFKDLHHLEVLNLDKNYFLFKWFSAFNPVFLKPLLRLHTLSLLAQEKTCLYFKAKESPYMYSGSSYPENLQSLYIDCCFCKFDSSFLRLTNLTLLSFSSVRGGSSCAMYEMDNTTFIHTPFLETLNISDCQVTYARPGIFDPFRSLRKLDMSMYLDYSDEFDAFIEASKSLRFSPIEYIKFVSFHSVQTNPDLFSYLKDTTLKELHMVGIVYPLIELHTFEKLPRSLEVLTIKHFQYTTAAVITELKHHPSLKTLELSDAIVSGTYRDIPNNVLPMQSLVSISPLVETYICRGCQCSECLETPNSGLIPYESPEMRLKHIKKLILPDNGIQFFTTYVYKRLPFVEYIDISNNRLENLDPFPKNNSIRYLNVASNNLGIFLSSKNTSTLKSLSKLEIVNFTYNGVFSVSTYGFQQLRSAKVINVSNNYLETINIRLNHLNMLEILDLSNNKIHAIGDDTRDDLSRLSQVRLYLDGNPLVCGCDELASIQWMKENRKQIHNLNHLNCRLSTGKHESLNYLDEIIIDLQTLCKSNIVEISVSVSVTVSVLSLVAGVLVYRHRWKLRYLYYAGRRGYRRRYNHECIHLEDYQYDAFISYADPDRAFVFKEMVQELEEKHGLKLCVHHRDFLPGEVISDNIVNAIQNSRKTVVVLSPSFLKSDWCEFEFNMARMEGVTRRQDIVLMLLYEYVSMMNLSKDMASMLKRNCYLEYNHEMFNKEIFWYNVQESIQTIRQGD